MQIGLPKTGFCPAALPRLTGFRITHTLVRAVLEPREAITDCAWVIRLVLQVDSFIHPAGQLYCTIRGSLYIGKNQEKAYPS